MYFLKLLIIIYIYCILVGCGPMAAVSAVGTTVNNAAYNAAERELNHPKKSYNEQALEVAIANMKLGIEYMRQGAYENALTKLNRSILAKPDFAPSYNVLGLLYQRLGDPVEAENNFRKSIKLEPSDSSTYNNYGLFLCSNNRIDEAEASFLNAANNPLYDSPEIALATARICYFRNKPSTEKSYFKQALNKNPRYIYALFQMAEISFDRNEYESAYQYYSRYINNGRQTPKSLWLGIKICKELGYEDNVSSYALLLRNKYPDSNEAKMLMDSQM